MTTTMTTTQQSTLFGCGDNDENDDGNKERNQQFLDELTMMTTTINQQFLDGVTIMTTMTIMTTQQSTIFG